MNIAFFSTKSYDRDIFDQYQEKFSHQLTYFELPLNPQTVELAKDFEGVCVFVNDQLDKEVIEALAGYGHKVIALRCAGFNNVDLKAANEHEMAVVRVPAYSPHAVAEHAVALILTLNRKTHKAYNRIREGNFSLERLTGFDLYQKTVGVVGTGKIGQVFAQLMQGFGCKVLASDPYPNDRIREMGIPYLGLMELLETSDIVSLHCPLTPETDKLINAETIWNMKPGSMLINTSRGGLVDTRAVIQALKSKHLGHLGIDVYEQEEQLFFQDLSETIIDDDLIARLMSFPNVLITAHQAFFTREALQQIAQTTLNNLTEVENGQQLTNEVCL